MSSSNDGNDGDKDHPFRKVQTTNLLVNEDNMSSLRDLLEVFLRIRLGTDQQEVVMISETQLETFGPFIREQLTNLAIMTAHGSNLETEHCEPKEEGASAAHSLTFRTSVRRETQEELKKHMERAQRSAQRRRRGQKESW